MHEFWELSNRRRLHFSQAQAIVQLLQFNSWTDIAMLYYVSRSSLIPRCDNIFSDLEVKQFASAVRLFLRKRFGELIQKLAYYNRIITVIRKQRRYGSAHYFEGLIHPSDGCIIFCKRQNLMNANVNMSIAYRRQLFTISNETFSSALKSIKEVSRGNSFASAHLMTSSI